jgi:hypothetical protein
MSPLKDQAGRPTRSSEASHLLIVERIGDLTVAASIRSVGWKPTRDHIRTIAGRQCSGRSSSPDYPGHRWKRIDNPQISLDPLETGSDAGFAQPARSNEIAG